MKTEPLVTNNMYPSGIWQHSLILGTPRVTIKLEFTPKKWQSYTAFQQVDGLYCGYSDKLQSKCKNPHVVRFLIFEIIYIKQQSKML